MSTETPNFSRLDEIKKLARLPIKKINPGKRLREEYFSSSSKWKEFKQNLKERGQIQPIAVMEYEKDVADSLGYSFFLLEGGRRLKALQELGETEIDAVVYPSDLNPYELKSIELEGNIQRKDMTVAEIAKGRAELLSHWQRIYGEKTSTSPNAPGISIRDAAKKMGVDKMTLIQDIKIAKLFNDLPQAKEKISTRAEALNLIKKADKIVESKKKIAIQEKSLTGDTESQVKERIIERYQLAPKGFLSIASDLNTKFFDLVNFDPDYPTHAEGNIMNIGANNSILDGSYKNQTKEEFEKFFTSSLQEFKRIMKPDSWLIVWFGYEYFQKIQDWLLEAGFQVNYNHGKWVKNNPHTRNPRRFLGHTIEPFFYAKLGSAEIQKPHPDTFYHNPTPSTKKINNYEKPIPLMQEIYETFLLPGSVILSPCVGSGNDILAALNSKNLCTGIDVSKEQKEGFKLKVLEQEIGRYK